jgi:hypothetical protein
MTRVKVDKKKKVITVQKERVTAVLLAIFFSFFAWLYTYKLDSGKFWTGLIISVFLGWLILPAIAVWVWAIIDVSVKDGDMYTNYSKWAKK